MNISPDQLYLQGEQFLAAGQLQEASAVCQQLLNDNPANAHGYFLLGKLYNATGNADKALEFASRAIELARQKDPAFHYLRGNIYLLKERLFEAEADLKLALALDNRLALAALLLGTTYIKMHKPDLAFEYLDKAKALGLEKEAQEQRGLLFQSEEKFEEAIVAFDRLIQLVPNHANAYTHRGRLNFILKRYEAAESDINRALQLNPNNPRNWVLIAYIHTYRKEYQQTIQPLQNALLLKHQDLEAWHLLASAYYRMGHFEKSVAAYEEILKTHPNDAIALSMMPSLLMVLGREEEARDYLYKGLQVNPDNPVLRHFQAIMEKQTIDSASADYVQQVFDGYAEKFDHHLQDQLMYRIPEKMARAVRASLGLADDQQAALSLLDLGCGTGLAGMALQSITQHRVGVDLSPKMLEKAEARRIYDQLVVDDVASFLGKTTERFDLITSADVFVYIGNLAPIMEAAYGVLTPGGRFAFSVEGDDQAEHGFTLLKSGRFAHSGAYLRQLAERYGYRIELLQPEEIRHEALKPIQGYLAIFSRPA